jgi:hypothetical protein
MTAEVVSHGFLVKNRMGDKSIFVVDIRERVYVVAPLHEVQQVGNGKDPVGIELDPLFADGNGKIEFTALFQHPEHIVPADEMASIVQTIPVASEAEVFHGMQARKGVAVIDEREILSRKVCPGKADVGNIEILAADIKNLYFPERSYVPHEPIDTGADVYMP